LCLDNFSVIGVEKVEGMVVKIDVDELAMTGCLCYPGKTKWDEAFYHLDGGRRLRVDL
jgi:hypothetical protein